MIVVFHGIDRPDSAELRAATRPAHLEFQERRGNLLGGPLRDDDGRVIGTVIVFEAPDVATAREDLADDPYVRAGLFETSSITEFGGRWPPDGGASPPD